MQVSPPPLTGGAGQHHQVEPGEESTPCKHTARYFQYYAFFGSFQAMLLESIDSRTILIWLPLDSSAMCPSTEHPLANVSQELRRPTIVPSAV